MGRLTNDEIRNRAISIIRNLTAEENGLTHGDLGILSNFLLIERTDKDKLTHYEDLEEQGRLIELPCAVGDTVYEVVPLPMLFDDLKQGYTILEKEFGFNDLKDFVDWIFLTKEEAEAKLKELEGVGRSKEVIETIYKQYMLQYEKDGFPPTRIILGVEVVREVLKGNPPYIDEFGGKIRCFGKPVTVDMANRRLIHISKGEDYTVELEGDKEW